MSFGDLRRPQIVIHQMVHPDRLHD